VKRAWPFESKTEGIVPIRAPEDFLTKLGAEGTEAIVIRIGLHDTMLVLVDADGRWSRWVYRSKDDALREAQALGIPVHEDEYPEETRVRMGKYQPPAEHYAVAAYPEQGRVGPVIDYPENRPRRAEVAGKEQTEASPSEKEAGPES
jgi:hypothetical protein